MIPNERQCVCVSALLPFMQTETSITATDERTDTPVFLHTITQLTTPLRSIHRVPNIMSAFYLLKWTLKTRFYCTIGPLHK